MKATEQEKQRMREYYQNNKEKWRGKKLTRKQRKRKTRLEKIWRRKNIDKFHALEKSRRRKIKDACFKAYGGYECSCCKIIIVEFLTLDHIKGGGNKHKKERRQTLYQWLYHKWLTTGRWPKGFQVLCMNCNWGKHLSGVCPHRRKHCVS